jgi:hypothetical protein
VEDTVRQNKRRNILDSVTLYCLLLAGSGVFLVYWAKKRGFVRENHYGVEQYPSYGRKIISRLTDGVVQAAGYGCVGAAIVILLVEYASEYLALAIILCIAFKLDDEWHDRRK